jgi:hypothetical protein
MKVVESNPPCPHDHSPKAMPKPERHAWLVVAERRHWSLPASQTPNSIKSMKTIRSAPSPSLSLHFVFAAAFLFAAQTARVMADPPASLLPGFGNTGEKFTVQAKDGHAVHGWLPEGWVDNSVWAAVNATYSKLDDSPDKEAGAVRIKIDNVDEGHLQLTSFLGKREYKKGVNYVVTGWVRSPDHTNVKIGDREVEEPHDFYDQIDLPTTSEWKRFEFDFTPEMDCGAWIMFVFKQPGTVDLAGIVVSEKR